MISWLDTIISINTLIWLFPIAFMLHDFEEIIWVESWFKKNYHKVTNIVPSNFRQIIRRLSKVTTSQFSIAVAIEFIIFIPTTFIASEYDNYLFFLGFNVALFLHAFIHLGQALIVRMYIPGIITTILVTIPYSIYLFYRLLSEQIITWNDIFLSAPAGLILIPIVLFGHYIGPKIISNNYN